MNKLRELMIQCEKGYCQDHDDYFYDMEKFAELIVRECADHIDDLVTCDDDGNQILDCDDVRTELLEHFGVES